MYARDPGFCSLPENNETEGAAASIILVLTTRATLPTSYKVDTSVNTHLTEGIHAEVDCTCGMYRVHSGYELVY